MPTYEYRCTGGHQYEKREGFSAPARQKCPTCGKQAQRMLFAPPIVFKGSGFYKTDSRGTSSATADSDSATTKPAAEPAVADTGHTHGPGGHSHDAPASTPAAADAAAS